jgi:hypothetical protein
MNPYEVNTEFPFDKMALNSPNAMQGGGAYFTKITVDNSSLYVQFPRCSSKNGIVSTKRSCYIDLTYDIQNCSIIKEWLNNIEKKSKDLIDNKKSLWFSGEVTRADIDSMMAPVYREINSINVLAIRCKIDTSKRSDDIKCKIYDEQEREITDINTIEKDTTIIPLVAIEGIKFTGRSIDLEMKVVQIMILDKQHIQDNQCLIKRKNKVLPEKDVEPVKIDMAALRENNIDNDNSGSESENDSEIELEVENINDTIGELKEVDIDIDDSLTNSKDESNNDLTSVSSNTNTSQATSISPPEGLEQVTLTIDEKGEKDNQDVKGDVTLGSLSDLPETFVEETKTTVKNEIEEIHVKADEGDAIKLKQPQEVYIEIYRVAKEKAKKLKQAAMEAYLEVKQIKTNYMLDNLDDSDDEDFKVINN